MSEVYESIVGSIVDVAGSVSSQGQSALLEGWKFYWAMFVVGWGLVVGTVVYGWWLDVVQDSDIERSSWWLGAGLGAVLLGAYLMYDRMVSGFVFPWIAIIAYGVWTWKWRAGTTGVFGWIALIVGVLIWSWVMPGFWDAYGWVNWQNWVAWYEGAPIGTGTLPADPANVWVGGTDINAWADTISGYAGGGGW